MDKKKVGGASAALIGALLYGGSELMDMQSRLDALEKIHPELTTGEPMDEDLEKASEEPEKASEEVEEEGE